MKLRSFAVALAVLLVAIALLIPRSGPYEPAEATPEATVGAPAGPATVTPVMSNLHARIVEGAMTREQVQDSEFEFEQDPFREGMTKQDVLDIWGEPDQKDGLYGLPGWECWWWPQEVLDDGWVRGEGVYFTPDGRATRQSPDQPPGPPASDAEKERVWNLMQDAFAAARRHRDIREQRMEQMIKERKERESRQ